MSTQMSTELAVVSEQGLRLTPGMDFEEWKAMGAALGAGQNAYAWAIGDWLFFGEWEYGSRYEEAVDVTGMSRQALMDLKYVAGRFEFSRRRENLSLQHHREVAPRPLEEQDEWLDQAEAKSMSSKDLRTALAEDRASHVLPAATTKSPVDKPVEVRVLPTDTQLSLDLEIGRVAERLSHDRGVALAVVDDVQLDSPGVWSEPVLIRFVERSPGLYEMESKEVEGAVQVRP